MSALIANGGLPGMATLGLMEADFFRNRMPREIEIRNKAEKDLRAIPKRDGERIAKAIMALQSGLAGDVKRLTNFAPEYRLRVGDWRVLFEIEADKITIYRILHRREAYRG